MNQADILSFKSFYDEAKLGMLSFHQQQLNTTIHMKANVKQ